MKTIDTPELLECGHPESPHSDITRGYGTDSQGNRHCYACCAERDKQQMRDTGKICLYLTYESGANMRTDNGCNRFAFGRYFDGKLTNWPGSLSIPCRVRIGQHNIARTRYDVWFVFEGQEWHGVQYGENTQICHCRKTKTARN